MRAEREGMDCAGCILAPRRWRGAGASHDCAVFGSGSLQSGLAFVAEGPGDTEVVQGEPLVGATGWWFRTLLGDAGLRFDEVYRTNAILCQAPGKGSELTGSAWGAVEHCRPSLQHEARWLIQNGVRVFVAMGNAALQGLLPGAPGIMSARGYVFPFYTEEPADESTLELQVRGWVVPTLHPSPKNLKGKGSGWALVVNDILKAKRIVAQGGPRPRQFRRILRPTEMQVFQFFGRVRPLVVDIENTMDGRLVCIGFCDGETTLVVPKLQQGGGEYWSAEQWKGVAGAITLALEVFPTIYQNGVHDVVGLEREGFYVGNWVRDTMLTHAAVYPDQLHSLHHLGSLYHMGPPWKSGRQESTAPEELD